MTKPASKHFDALRVPFYSIGNMMLALSLFIILSIVGDITYLLYPELIVAVTPAHLVASIITTVVLGAFLFFILLFLAAELYTLHEEAHELDEDDEDDDDIERIEIAVVMVVEPKPDNTK